MAATLSVSVKTKRVFYVDSTFANSNRMLHIYDKRYFLLLPQIAKVSYILNRFSHTHCGEGGKIKDFFPV
jgi:hypothetical protein